MTKQKKKRNKSYTGQNAAITRPIVTRLSAVKRNKFQQWWFEKKRLVKPALIATAVVIVVIWLLLELVRILGGGA
jgi:hypothetical protein